MFTKKEETTTQKPATKIGWGSKEPKITSNDISKVNDRIDELAEDLNWVCIKMDAVLSRLGLQDD